MEKEQVQSALQTLLAGKNLNPNSNKLTTPKKEKLPACIKKDSGLISFYETTDLEFYYVYECCKSLKPLKGIDVNLQQVEFWYREFLRMQWTKNIFNKQFNNIKRAILYNRIDFENWLQSETTYNEHDFNLAVKNRVDSIIARGNYLKDKKIELNEADKKAVGAAVAMDRAFKASTNRLELIENYKLEISKKGG